MAYDFKLKHTRDQTGMLADMVGLHAREIAMLKKRVSSTAPMARPRSPERGPETPENIKNKEHAESPAPRGVPAKKYADLVATRPGAAKTTSNAAASSSPVSKPDQPSAQAAQPVHPDIPVFSKFIIQERLDDAVLRGDIEIFTQPVLRIPENTVVFFEIFTRLRVKPGLYIPAQQYGDMARQKNIQPTLDRLLLVRCLQMLKTSGDPENITPFFINLDPGLLKDPGFLSTLLLFSKQNRALLKYLYFELPHDYFLTMPAAMLNIMQILGALGCNFALDHVEKVQARHFDVQRLMDYKIRSVKIPTRLFLNRTDPERYRELMRIKNTLEGNGIKVIAEKVEGPLDIKNLQHLNLQYGQGYALGQPKPQMAGHDIQKAV